MTHEEEKRLLEEKLKTLNELEALQKKDEHHDGIPHQELYIPNLEGEQIYNPGWERLRNLTRPFFKRLRGEK